MPDAHEILNMFSCMNVEIRYHAQFLKDAKRLAKRYPSFKKDYVSFLDQLTKNPLLGVSLGKGVRKLRLAITSKGKGKSGGARVLTFVVDLKSDDSYEVTLLTMYDKEEIDNVSDTYIKYLLETM